MAFNSKSIKDLFDRLKSIEKSNERKAMYDVPSRPQGLTEGGSDGCFYIYNFNIACT